MLDAYAYGSAPMKPQKTNLREHGRLFVFEGADDVGKTTLATTLSNYLLATGNKAECLSFPGNEPGTLGELVYRFYRNPNDFGVPDVSSIAMQLVVTAAHVEVVESRVKPLIRAGVDVVLDRFWWSTQVYALIEGVPQDLIDKMIELELHVWEDITPTCVFLVLRETPFIKQAVSHPWAKIVSHYNALFETERSNAPIHLIINDGTVTDAMQVVISHVN